MLAINYRLWARTANYRWSKNSAYSGKHIRLREIFHKG